MLGWNGLTLELAYFKQFWSATAVLLGEGSLYALPFLFPPPSDRRRITVFPIHAVRFKEEIAMIHIYLGKCTKTGRNGCYLYCYHSPCRDQIFWCTFLKMVVDR